MLSDLYTVIRMSRVLCQKSENLNVENLIHSQHMLISLGRYPYSNQNGIGRVTFSSRSLCLAYGKYPKYQDLPSGHDGFKTILHMNWCGTRKLHPRTGRISQKWGSVEFLTKLFRFEGGISLSHTNTFSRLLCDFLRIFGVTNEFSRWKTCKQSLAPKNEEKWHFKRRVCFYSSLKNKHLLTKTSWQTTS